MLPFGQGFPLGMPHPNLFGSRIVTGISMPMIVTTNASLLTNPVIVNRFAPTQPPQPMMIGPDVLATIPHPDVFEPPPSGSASSIDVVSASSSTVAPAVTAGVDDHWTEHKANDGRIYYYNRTKNISSWVKPDVMKTPEERERSVWRTYKTPEGKEYYYNIQTKETTWNKPTILRESESNTKSSNDIIIVDEVKPSPFLLDATSDIERAMAATLRKLEGGFTEPTTTQKASTSKKNGDIEAANSEKDGVKRRQIDKFREVIKEKYDSGRINTGMSWEQAMKYIQQDVRFCILPKVSEKKQVYNAWKVQRSKEERDERRLSIKKAKEDLEKWLVVNPKMRATLRYQRADALFANEVPWRAVSDPERRDIFCDMLSIVGERDEKAKKELRERNVKALADILDGIEEVNHCTTWAQAQRILIENLDFASDNVLQGMDKEDALVVFQDHIRAAEQLYVKEKQLEAKRIRRQERKVRESFMHFLHELNSKGILTSTATWRVLYPTISADQRFESMLVQTGSTALDLFKFYVESLKNQYYEDRHTIREILDELKAVVTTEMTFEHLQQWVKSDARGKQVDVGNMKLCYNSLYDKALAKERECERELQRKQKRQESAFRNILRLLSPEVEPETEWKDVRGKIKNENAFITIDCENLREQFFQDYIKSISEACGHHHGSGGGAAGSGSGLAEKSKKKKKDKRKKKKKEERDSDGEMEPKSKKLKKSHYSEELSDKAEKKKKKSRRRLRTPFSADEGEIVERIEKSNLQTAIIKNISDESDDMLSDISATELERERSAILQKLTTEDN